MKKSTKPMKPAKMKPRTDPMPRMPMSAPMKTAGKEMHKGKRA